MHREGGPAGLLLLGELARHALIGQGMPATGGSLAAQILLGHDRDGGVEHLPHAGLEQQRHLHDGGARRRCGGARLLQPLGDALTDQRPQQTLKPASLLGVLESLAGHRRAVDDAPRRHRLAPARHDGVAHLRAAIELVYDRVRGEHRRSQAL